MTAAARLQDIKGREIKGRDDEQVRPLAEAEKALETFLVGQPDVIELSLAALVAGGHLLLEGMPGVGKTSLARGLARVFQGGFKRVQMTPDLLPTEIIGGLRPKSFSDRASELVFHPGPVFTNFLLVDELNRSTAKTQSALLEAMAEGTVSVDGVEHPLPTPFFVVATQNPIESHGVFPLAESQLDRFMLLVTLALPAADEERAVYRQRLAQPGAGGGMASAPGSLEDASVLVPGLTLESLVAHRRRMETETFVSDILIEYVMELIQKTRTHRQVTCGVSIRGGIQFLGVARAVAYLRGRRFVTPADVALLAEPCLAHRLRLQDDVSDFDQKRRVMREVLESVRAPS